MKDKKISVQTQTKFKGLIASAKKQGLIKPHVQAFKEVPVNNEKHKGNPKYFCN